MTGDAKSKDAIADKVFKMLVSGLGKGSNNHVRQSAFAMARKIVRNNNTKFADLIYLTVGSDSLDGYRAIVDALSSENSDPKEMLEFTKQLVAIQIEDIKKHDLQIKQLLIDVENQSTLIVSLGVQSDSLEAQAQDLNCRYNGLKGLPEPLPPPPRRPFQFGEAPEQIEKVRTSIKYWDKKETDFSRLVRRLFDDFDSLSDANAAKSCEDLCALLEEKNIHITSIFALNSERLNVDVYKEIFDSYDQLDTHLQNLNDRQNNCRELEKKKFDLEIEEDTLSGKIRGSKLAVEFWGKKYLEEAAKNRAEDSSTPFTGSTTSATPSPKPSPQHSTSSPINPSSSVYSFGGWGKGPAGAVPPNSVNTGGSIGATPPISPAPVSPSASPPRQVKPAKVIVPPRTVPAQFDEPLDLSGLWKVVGGIVTGALIFGSYHYVSNKPAKADTREAVRICDIPSSTVLMGNQSLVNCWILPKNNNVIVEDDRSDPSEYKVSAQLGAAKIEGWGARVSFSNPYRLYSFKMQDLPSDVSTGIPRQVYRNIRANRSNIRLGTATGDALFYPYVSLTRPKEVAPSVTEVNRAPIQIPNYLVEVSWCSETKFICEVGANLPGYGDVFGVVRENQLASILKHRSKRRVTGRNPS